MRRCVLLLTALLLTSGCARMNARAIVHPHSSVTSPTFCYYSESWRGEKPPEPERSQNSEPRAIGRLEVGLINANFNVIEEAWVIHYLPDPLYEELTPYSCITYGKLPPGYREQARAVPLIPGRHYWVRIKSLKGYYEGGNISFHIRLDSNGHPAKLEYSDDNSSPSTIKTLP